MLPEEKARVKIDKQLRNAGWDIVARNEYLPNSASAVKEALMGGNTESDYFLFIDGKAIAVVEAKREENPLGDEVKKQAEDYAVSLQDWYGLWFEKLIPLVYMANGNKIYFKNMLVENSDYEELSQMHSPKKMLQIIGKKSEYGALPLIEKRGLRDCQYRAEVKFEELLKMGNKKNLAVLATGSGKTYLACLAVYRLLNYTPTKRILFLVDRNNLARQTESELSVFDRTEGQQKMGNLYTINSLKKEEDIKGDIVISTIQKLFCVLTGQEINDSDEDAEDEKAKADEEKDSIVADDIVSLRQVVSGQKERVMEAEFNYDVEDSTSTILETERIVKIRKLNKKIGDNLKLLYGYRCQICGQLIGEEFGSHIVEAHHIDYFVSSLNNDASNQLIVCPNHYSIIHDTNPVFDRRRLLYIYKNGLEQKLVLNQHL